MQTTSGKFSPIESVNRQDADCRATQGWARSDFLWEKTYRILLEYSHRCCKQRPGDGLAATFYGGGLA